MRIFSLIRVLHSKHAETSPTALYPCQFPAYDRCVVVVTGGVVHAAYQRIIYGLGLPNHPYTL